MSLLKKLGKEYIKKWHLTEEDYNDILDVYLVMKRERNWSYGKMARWVSRFVGFRISERQVRYFVKKYRFVLRVGEENYNNRTKKKIKEF